jgi:hypothetical protein
MIGKPKPLLLVYIQPNSEYDCFEYNLGVVITTKLQDNEIILFHDKHPLDYPYNAESDNKDSWHKIKLEKDSVSNDYLNTYDLESTFSYFLYGGRYTYRMPNKFFCQSGILRKFKIYCNNEPLLVDVNYMHVFMIQTPLKYCISTVPNSYGENDNCIYFNDKLSIAKHINNYVPNLIGEFNNENYLKWLYKTNLRNIYFEEKYRFTNAYFIKLPYIKFYKMQIITQCFSQPSDRHRKFRIVHTNNDKHWSTDEMKKIEYCPNCKRKESICQCNPSMTMTYVHHYKFKLINTHMFQYKLIDKNGNYFCVYNGPKIKNRYGTFNNYFYRHQNETYQKHISKYVDLLNISNKEFIDDEYTEYLLAKGLIHDKIEGTNEFYNCNTNGDKNKWIRYMKYNIDKTHNILLSDR